MILSNLAIDRSITVFVILVLLAVTGIYSYVVLPRESSPEVIVPFINVVTTYEGVAPGDIETLITIPIERKLTGTSGVKQIKSSSVEGMSNISVEFEADLDVDDVLQKVKDKVDQAKPDLPAEADDPFVYEINISELPIITVALTGRVGVPVLTDIAEDLEDAIETIPGVLNVQVVGGVTREIEIEVDPKRVVQYGVSLADLVSIAQLENVNTPGGTLDIGEAKYNMRVPGEFTNPAELFDLVVKSSDTGIVYLRDIATVKDTFKELTTLSRLDGEPSVTLAISKRSGENIIRISDDIRALLEEASRTFPATVEATITTDLSNDIRDIVAELENSILSGLILVLAVIFLFMGLSNAFFISLAIPFSMFVAFTLLYLSDVTLNMVVLFSLILALGMLVDNGIVVVENIYRHVHMGKNRVQAAKDGAAEVAWPIIGSTLTTIVAFLPLLFWPGIMGSFMLYLPMTLIMALSGSLFVGLIVNPALASLFMKEVEPDAGTPSLGRRIRYGATVAMTLGLYALVHPPRSLRDPEARGVIPRAFDRTAAAVLSAYEGTLRLALRWPGSTLALAVVLLALITTYYFTHAHVVFFPETEPRRAWIDIEAPEGTNLATSDALVRQVEALIEPYREHLKFVITNVGSKGVSFFGETEANTTHLSRVTLEFPKLAEQKRRPSAIIAELREKCSAITGAEVRIDREQEGPPAEPPVNIEISGDDFATLASLAQEVQDRIKHVPNLVDLRDDYDKGKPEVRVIVDRQQAWREGLNTQFIGLTVKAAVNGRKAGEYREGDEEYDVTVRFPKDFREDLTNLEDMELINLNGQPIPFSSVARLEHGAGLGSITRVDRRRTVTVTAEVEEAPGRYAADVLRDVQTLLADLPLPPGYSINYTGENKDQEEAMAFLSKAFIMALLLVALVLVAQFNSIIQPLIIMTSVILSLAGVFLGLIVFDMPFSTIMTGIGIISLAGVVVNNAIVLLDFVLQLRARGLPREEAVVQAGVTRFRPVMLTAITTILGLIPMVFGLSYDFRNFDWIVGGDSAQWWGPMAVAVAFGLAFATVLTLVVVPTLYSVVDRLFDFVRALFRGPAVSVEIPAK